MADSNQTFDLGVAGGGPAGLATALLAARAGLNVALVAPKAQDDHRTFALMAGAVRMLQRIGVWERVASSTAPLRTLRIIDDTGRLLRAPTVEFHADEIDLDAFAWNFPAGPLVRALEDAVAEEPRIRRFETNVSGVTPGDAGPVLGLGDGTSVAARAIAAADGRGSICREAAGIAVDRWSYPQTALVTTIEHDRPHGFVSTEFHRRTGPYTLVPLPGQRSSVVLVETAKGAEELMSLDDDALGAELSRRSHRLLGQVRIAGPRAAFPLSGLLPRSFAQNGIALIGEAAHVVPPIGAQGLNLGLRDAAMLAECLTGASDPAAALQAYDRRRRTDVVSRTAAIDLLNRSLLSDLVPAQAARSLGLFAMSRIEPLRQRMMREGVAPGDATLPEIMRADDDTPSARSA